MLFFGNRILNKYWSTNTYLGQGNLKLKSNIHVMAIWNWKCQNVIKCWKMKIFESTKYLTVEIFKYFMIKISCLCIFLGNMVPNQSNKTNNFHIWYFWKIQFFSTWSHFDVFSFRLPWHGCYLSVSDSGKLLVSVFDYLIISTWLLEIIRIRSLLSVLEFE